jgi:NAD-dependent dihydropyrimidine dehydrogenase PreA subunit
VKGSVTDAHGRNWGKASCDYVMDRQEVRPLANTTLVYLYVAYICVSVCNVCVHYMIKSRHQNSGQDHNIRIANESFENVAKSKYFGTTLTNQNDVHNEIKSRLNSGNVCYHSRAVISQSL